MCDELFCAASPGDGSGPILLGAQVGAREWNAEQLGLLSLGAGRGVSGRVMADASTAMGASPVLVGRASELRTLTAIVREAREGRARGVLVRGAPGVGKTRLLREVASESAGRGVRVARSNCLPLTTALPFDPVLGLLRSLGEPLPPGVTESPRDLFGMVVDRLERATVDGPLLLGLDDLQWSDAGTIDLVHYCLARLTDLPIAWLIAARPAESVDRLAHRLMRAGALGQLELGPLSAGDVGRLAGAILGEARVSDRLASVLYARTGGNPFLCEELLRALGDVAAPEDSSSDRTSAIDRLVPASVSEAIEERASRLPATAQDALGWAVVLPEPFTFKELQAVGGEELGTAPESLAAASFLSSDGERRWSFVHAIARDAVYQRLPEGERVRRHGVVADALTDGPLERRAPQLVSAQRWREAAEAYLRLARTAVDRGRGVDAVELCQRAGALAAEGDAERLRRDAKAGEVLALLRAGETERAAELAGVVLARLRADGEPDERLGFLSGYAIALNDDARDRDRAREALSEAELLIADADGPVLAEALAVRAFVRIRDEGSASVLADAERAAQLAEGADDPPLLARALNTLGSVVGRTRGAREGMAILERAVTAARAADLPALEARARLSLSYLAAGAGDIKASEAHARKGLEVDGVPAGLAVILRVNIGSARLDLGDFDGALAHGLAALREATRLGGPRAEAVAALALGHVYLERGDLPAARRLLESHAAASDRSDSRRAAELWGMLLEEEGAPAQALARFQEGAAYAGEHTAAWCLTRVARTAVAVGELTAARDALTRLDALAERWPVAEWLRDEARGWLAVGENRPAKAAAAFRAAAAAACTQEAYEAARLRLEAARLTGDRDQVRGAIDAFEGMGAARAADRARAVARSLGMRPGRRRAPAGALSAREQEITQLVAAGQTNAEIAAALYLSPRTVEHYVSNILTKLGYRSRVQIASEAAAGRLPGSGATTPSTN